jgi:beta-glucosidase
VAAQVRDGAFDEAHLDRAASRVTQLIMAAKNNAAPAEVDFDAHHALARRAAAEGAVLLKNTGLLPLKAGASVALIGAFADTPRFQGAGSSQVNAAKLDRRWMLSPSGWAQIMSLMQKVLMPNWPRPMRP